MFSSYTHFQESWAYSQGWAGPWNMRISVEASHSYRGKAVTYEKMGKCVTHCFHAYRVECAHQIYNLVSNLQINFNFIHNFEL